MTTAAEAHPSSSPATVEEIDGEAIAATLGGAGLTPDHSNERARRATTDVPVLEGHRILRPGGPEFDHRVARNQGARMLRKAGHPV